MKKLLIALITFSFLSCSQNNQEIKLSYKIPKEKTYTYTFSMESKKLTITQEIDFKVVDITQSTLEMNAEIKKMNWKSNSTLDKETNEYYQRNFIDRPVVFKINKQGKVIENLAYLNSNQKMELLFDINNFFIELPNDSIQPSYSWKRTRPIDDIMFNEITTTYTFKKIIKDSLAYINVFSDLKGDSEGFTKSFNGIYLLNIKNGMLEEGKLEIAGFNGFNNISGDIRIYKK